MIGTSQQKPRRPCSWTHPAMRKTSPKRTWAACCYMYSIAICIMYVYVCFYMLMCFMFVFCLYMSAFTCWCVSRLLCSSEKHFCVVIRLLLCCAVRSKLFVCVALVFVRPFGSPLFWHCFCSHFLRVYRPWEVSHLFSHEISYRMHSESCLGTPWPPKY